MDLQARNNYSYIIVDGESCVCFITGGKKDFKVIVDAHTWENYLHKYHWTGYQNGSYPRVQTSINKHTTFLPRVIIKKEYSELDYWGMTVDHINNNPLDNRLANLRIYNSKLNCTNVKSKNKDANMHLIFRQNSGSYKVHTNIFDETRYKCFPTLPEAINYRDNVILPYIEKRVSEMKKKSRDIEFERGLRDKINNSETGEVLAILKKYGVME